MVNSGSSKTGEKVEQSLCDRYNIVWNMTAIRIKDPEISVPFYQRHFNMRLVKKVPLTFLQPPCCNYIMETPISEDDAKKESWENRWTLNLVHFLGDEKNLELKMNNGNNEPYRGFGHIAFNCDDVYKSCEFLDKNGVKFHKKPDDGRMKGLAFALDPDGYWIEVVSRDNSCNFKQEFNLSQTMIRVKDPKKSLTFYRDILGMSDIRELHFPKARGDFSLYFLTHLSPSQLKDDALLKSNGKGPKVLWQPCLELTHNHGTEIDDDFQYHTGHKKPVGFRHLGFQCDDIAGLKKSLEEFGYPTFVDTKVRLEIADPDGYICVFVDRKMAQRYFEKGIK